MADSALSRMDTLPVSIASLGLRYCKNDGVVGQDGKGLNLIDMALLPLTPIVGSGTAPLQPQEVRHTPYCATGATYKYADTRGSHGLQMSSCAPLALQRTLLNFFYQHSLPTHSHNTCTRPSGDGCRRATGLPGLQ